MTDTRPQWLKSAQPFIAGGLAGCVATACVQPIDMIKVRIQLAGEIPGASKNPIVVTKNFIAQEGFAKLYKGLDAGIVRQLTYTTARMGIFRTLSESLKKDNEPLPFSKKAFASLAAGGLGAAIGNPADLALIRLQADSTLPVAERRNYTGVFHALTRIVKDEGVAALWTGSNPTIVRAMALNFGMLAPFDQAKEMLQARGWSNGLGTTLTASAVAGFFAVTFSLPFDFLKTRMQKMKPDANGVMPYKSMTDAALKIAKAEGPMAFYTGYPTYYVRIAPHSMITLMATDFLTSSITKAYRK